jgi:hypothetical protein
VRIAPTIVKTFPENIVWVDGGFGKLGRDVEELKS